MTVKRVLRGEDTIKKRQFFLVAALLFSVIFISSATAVPSSDWNYKRTITLSPATPEAEYQVKVELTLATFDYSKTNLDGSDLRFYDPSDNHLDYWIENWDPTGTSTIWVDIPSAGTSSIDMYYGNPSATSESSGVDTFFFFDDFDDNDISDWTGDTSEMEVTDGWLYGTDDNSPVEDVIEKDLPSTLSADKGFEIRFYFKVNPQSFDAGAYETVYMRNDTGNDVARIQWGDVQTNPGYGWLRFYDENLYMYNGFPADETMYPTYNGTLSVRYYDDLYRGFTGDTQKGFDYAHTRANDATKVQIGLIEDPWGGAQTGRFGKFDWIYVRVIAEPEPEATLGNEEYVVAYDDGAYEMMTQYNLIGGTLATRFTSPASGQLKMCSFFIVDDPQPVKIHVLDSDKIDIITPFTCDVMTTGWIDVDLSAHGVYVSSGVDFYIGIEWTVIEEPLLGVDLSSPDSRGWTRDSPGGEWAPWGFPFDFMIRGTVVEEEPATPYLVVRGDDNRIYYRLHNTTLDAWSSWSLLPGSTIDSPAAVVCNNELHVAVRGSDGHSLWHGYLNLTDDTFIGWTRLSGWTPSAPTLTSNGTVLFLVVRGEDNRIYYRTYGFSPRGWGSWSVLPSGWTIDGPAAAMLGNNLHIVVRGMDGSSLWNIIVEPGVGVVRTWIRLSGSTPSKPTLMANQTANMLYLAVRGEDNRIYWRSYNGAADTWDSWNLMPTGSTCDGPAATVADNKLHFVVCGMDGSTLWHRCYDFLTATYSDWMKLSGSTPSPPTLTS